MIHRRSPAVRTSKEQLSALTRRLLDLEAKVGLLEARLNERSHQSHPPTADQATATDISVYVPPTPVETQTECQQSIFIHPSGHGDFISTSGHLDNDDLGFPSNASTPFIDRTRPADITGDSAHLNHQLSTNSMLDYSSPLQEYPSSSPLSSTSQHCPSEMSSFCLRLPETPRNSSYFQSHNPVRRSLMGVVLQDVTLNHVSLEVEKQLYVDSAGSDGAPKADRFACGLFKRLIPFTIYQDWVGSVNYDGSKGKNALPWNLRQAISDAVARKFHPTPRDWKLIRDRINELLRKKRLSFPLFKRHTVNILNFCVL
ncbi:uncharacterized protein [Misgurnus anguillicaudatus]|uniref:uncharacterized protein n=1 Tax=Misgurnus anguillicaudatus TaxID=75329 RepID=UPI003CCF5AED